MALEYDPYDLPENEREFRMRYLDAEYMRMGMEERQYRRMGFAHDIASRLRGRRISSEEYDIIRQELERALGREMVNRSYIDEEMREMELLKLRYEHEIMMKKYMEIPTFKFRWHDGEVESERKDFLKEDDMKL